MSDPTTTLPGGLEIAAGMPPIVQAFALMIGTFILEDTTAITAGLLAHARVLSLPTAMLGTGIGIFLGDLGLYALGAAAARGARGTGWIRRRLPENRLRSIAQWFGRSGWKAIVFSRFVSGSRLPIYLGAGFVGAGFARFALWTFVAVLAWTPLVVGGTFLLGSSITALAHDALGTGPAAWIAIAIAVIVLMQAAILVVTRRRAVAIALDRARRFEFWPTWAIYAPLLPLFAWNAMRFGFARTLTAVNPCWPDSGAVGESKQAGLEAFDAAFVSPSFRTAPPDAGGFTPESIDAIVARLDGTGWTRGEPTSNPDAWPHPVIVKPDAGQRGLGVKVVRSEAALRELLAAARAPVIVQRFEAGECEVGLFFIRDPGTQGRLFSICDKRFPHAVGDGRATLAELIWRDPRLRLQAPVFLKRWEAQLDRVLAAGESLRLANAGNHAQGCLFLDGERLWTPELEAWVVRACASARGFNYGRLDVRFSDEHACRRGEGGFILEANGITSESTNMYDPSLGALRAWAIMHRHWRAAFRIGAANRANGWQGMTLREILHRRRRWLASADSRAIAD